MGDWNNPIYRWYEYHRDDYDAVRERLAACRNVMLHGREDAAVEMLKKSAVWSVMSIQTEKDRHEDAYVAWDHGLRLSNAMSQTVYGGQKTEWILDARAGFDYERAVELLRNKSAWVARNYVADEHTGLSYTKASFALAMVGIWELMCVDSNTKQAAEAAGLDVRIPDRIRSADAYADITAKIVDEMPIDDYPFIIQWAMYDANREEHARHMAFYRSVLYP